MPEGNRAVFSVFRPAALRASPREQSGVPVEATPPLRSQGSQTKTGLYGHAVGNFKRWAIERLKRNFVMNSHANPIPIRKGATDWFSNPANTSFTSRVVREHR